MFSAEAIMGMLILVQTVAIVVIVASAKKDIGYLADELMYWQDKYFDLKNRKGDKSNG